MDQHWTVGEVARMMSDRTGVEVRPKDVTNLFYARLLPGGRCPILGGRRLIPPDLLPDIERTLRERGRIPSAGNGGES